MIQNMLGAIGATTPWRSWLKGRRETIVRLFLAIAYGAALATLPLNAFKDRENYIVYAESAAEIIQRYWSGGVLSGLANEPIWLLINATLGSVLPPDAVIRLIIFVPATLVAWVVLRRDQYLIWLLLFLLVPQVIKNHVIQLRQGLAISVFLVGWFSGRAALRWGLVAVTPFIHASFFFILALIAIVKLSKRMSLGPEVPVALCLVASFVVGWGLEPIAAAFGARQADRFSYFTGVSELKIGFWLLIFAIMCLQGRAYLERYTFEAGALAFYLNASFLTNASARIFDDVMLLVLLAGLNLTGWRREIFPPLVVVFVLIQYGLRLGEPWFGQAAKL